MTAVSVTACTMLELGHVSGMILITPVFSLLWRNMCGEKCLLSFVPCCDSFQLSALCIWTAYNPCKPLNVRLGQDMSDVEIMPEYSTSAVIPTCSLSPHTWARKLMKKKKKTVRKSHSRCQSCERSPDERLQCLWEGGQPFRPWLGLQSAVVALIEKVPGRGMDSLSYFVPVPGLEGSPHGQGGL